MTAELQLAALRLINRRAELWDEGGQPLVYLPGMKVQHNGGTVIVDGCSARAAMQNRRQNWTAHQIMGRAWHTMSFNYVPASLPWPEILAVHLGQLK